MEGGLTVERCVSSWFPGRAVAQAARRIQIHKKGDMYTPCFIQLSSRLSKEIEPCKFKFIINLHIGCSINLLMSTNLCNEFGACDLSFGQLFVVFSDI